MISASYKLVLLRHLTEYPENSHQFYTNVRETGYFFHPNKVTRKDTTADA